MSHSDNDLLFESIQIRDGIAQRLDLHEDRMDRSRKEIFGSSNRIRLGSIIDVPEDLLEGIVKCKVIYGETIGRIAFERYVPRKHVGSVIVEFNEPLDYQCKYTRRDLFDRLEQLHPGKAVILSINGLITDATYANLAFFDGERWLTPESYLLNGVMRQWLLGRRMIEEAEISLANLPRYQSVKLINAMLEWEESPEIPLFPSHEH